MAQGQQTKHGHFFRSHAEYQTCRSLLISGTKVIQSSGMAIAVVIATGFNTSRGGLVRSILHPKPHDIKFQKDGALFIAVMVGWALLGFAYSIVTLYFGCMEAGDLVIQALDLITIAVPPGLPMALAIGIVYAQRRLIKKEWWKDIYIKNQYRIETKGGLFVQGLIFSQSPDT